ncbi:unnamed protein product [Brassicogethes aeneus]|uniref:Uncharacterized protein n=1 Tax=Brassicogethes aeneus TaxID=1431903 RepID=A0A9P0BE82_BRAAE|nr:unnamed protein product [Brassicogethes aeneus]
MFPNNMTGDPNQQNQSSIFGYEMYPPANAQPINWPEIQATQGFNNPHTYQFQSQNTQNDIGNFSFSSQRQDQPVVQFPFQVGSSFGVNSNTIRCKRKTDSPPLQQCKQHITEEKMAEHMSKLHISTETPSSSKETSTEKQQRLYLCEEMRKLKSDVIIPQCLIDRMQRPCTALVLWQPPPRILIPERIDNLDNNNEENLPDQQLRMENENVEYDMDM